MAAKMFGNIVFLLFFWDGSSTCAWGSRRIGVVVKCRHCIHGEISGPVYDFGLAAG